MYIGQPEVAALEEVRQLLVVKAKQRENGCMNVMHMDGILYGFKSDLIR
jgi:hypothetical protein